VIIPHLIFSHLLADYILQTNWLAARKGQFIAREIHSWDGLALHGLMVWLMSLAVLPRQIAALWPYITILALIHTFQDGLKVWISSRLHIHPFIPYLVDQLLHLITILIFQAAVVNYIIPRPGPDESWVMALGASLIAITRFYEVSWWANWPDMISYMNHWRWWGYTERITMLLLSMFNLWILAPLAVVPRLYAAWREGHAVWEQKRGATELLLGIAFSVILGLALKPPR